MKPHYDRAPVLQLTPEAWQDVRTLFEAALRRDPEEREGFVDLACAEKPDRRAQVMALLHAWNEEAGTFHDRGPSGEAPVQRR